MSEVFAAPSFGSLGVTAEIERKLLQIIESDAYQRAVHHWERKRSVGHLSGNGTLSSSTYNGTGFSNSSLAISFDSNTGKPDYASTATSASSTPMSSSVKKLKRFSGFEQKQFASLRDRPVGKAVADRFDIRRDIRDRTL